MNQENSEMNQTVDMSIEDVLESIEDGNRTSNLPTTVITQAQVDALASMSSHLTSEIIDQTRIAVLESETKTKDDEIQRLKDQLREANENSRSPELEGDDCDSELSCSSDESQDEYEGDTEAGDEVQIYKVDQDGDVNVSDPTVGSSDSQHLNAPPNQMDLPEYSRWELQQYAPRKSKMKTTAPLQMPGRMTSSTPTDTPGSPPTKPMQPSKKNKLKRVRPLLFSDDEDSQYDPLVENSQNPNSRVLKVQTTPKKAKARVNNLIDLDDDSGEDFRQRPSKLAKIESNPFISHSSKEDNRMELDSSACSSRSSPLKPIPKFRHPTSHGSLPSTSEQSTPFPFNTTYYKRNGTQWKEGRFKFHHNLTKIAIAAMTDNCTLPVDELKSKLDSIGQKVYTSSEAMCKHRWWNYVQQTYSSMQTPEVPSFMKKMISNKAQKLKKSLIANFRAGYLPDQSTFLQVNFFLKMQGRQKVTAEDLGDMMKDFTYTE